jgi:thiamine biosynthesis lipoprotein
MACTFEIQFPRGSISRGLALSCLDEVDEMERRLTVYRDDSETSRINRDAYYRPVEVDAALFDLLAECRRYWAETGGAFDATAGPLISAWGFKRRAGRAPSNNEIAEALLRVGTQHIQLNARARTVRMTRPGMEVNFGAVGKGYALDRISDRMSAHGIEAALLGAGGSSIRAMGSAPGTEGWLIDVSSPAERGAAAARLRLRDQAASTSGSTEQYFEHEGKRYGHVLDPRTGWPATSMRQATVVAPTALRAEALSTAVFVLGAEWMKDYCARNSDVGAVLFSVDANVPDVVGRVELAM